MTFFNTIKFITMHPLNRRSATAALIRFLKWQLGSRLVPGDVVYPWINGAKMIVRKGETGFTQNIYCGLQEFSEMAYLLHALKPQDLFVDVGANVGSYTILAGAAVGARVICFEPIPAAYDRLMANLRINQLEGSVCALNIGIGHEIGALRFTDDQDTMNHVLSASETSEGIAIEVSILDSVLEDEDPAFIKIDVEGFETRVLEGARNTLKKESLHSLIVELNGSGSRYGFDDEKIIALLGVQGFQPFDYDPFSRSLRPLTKKIPLSGNILFIRDSQALQNRIRSAKRYSIHGMEF